MERPWMLLIKHIESMPDNPRILFEISQTYYEMAIRTIDKQKAEEYINKSITHLQTAMKIEPSNETYKTIYKQYNSIIDKITTWSKYECHTLSQLQAAKQTVW